MSRFNTLSRPRSEPEAGGAFFAYVWSALAGLLVPVLVVLVGLLAVLLNSNSGRSQQSVQLGTHLQVPLPPSFANQAALMQLTQLVAVTFAVAAVFCLSVWLHRRAADRRARNVVKALHGRVLRQSLRRAELEGAAAQHVRAEQLIGHQLPSIQSGLSLWYRSIPRSVLTLIGCVALSLLVNVWLALLAVVSGVLLWQLFRRLRDTDQSDLADWEVPRARGRMAELVGQAPLLARLQAQGLADRAFGTELDTLYRRLASEETRRGRVWPIVFFATSAAIAVLVLVLGVNLFGVENGLSVPAALVLGLALCGAVAAAGRLSVLAAQLRESGEASDSVYHYLAPSDDIAPSEQRVGLAGLRDCVEIHDVTLGVPEDPILRHLSLKLTPGTFVALLGTESVSTRALAELAMGFGRPAEGRVTNRRDSTVGRSPTGAGAQRECGSNLMGRFGTERFKRICAAVTSPSITPMSCKLWSRVDVYERVHRLPEGLDTIVAAGDSMLGVETTYAIAVARAIIHKPPIVLAMEPPPPAEHLADDPCLKALRKLVGLGRVGL